MATKMFRSFVLDRAKVKKEDRTISMVFSSEYPVVRTNDDGDEFEEILSHDPEDVDLSRLKDGAPLLEMHDLNRQRGVIEGAELDPETKCGRAVARFSRSDEAERVFQDVLDGIRKHVSVGYELTGVKSSSKGTSGRSAIRFKWQPYEISVVSAPEDPNTGIGRSVDGGKVTDMRILLDPNPTAGGGAATPATTTPTTPADKPDLVVIGNRARDEERTRSKRITLAATELAKNFPEGAEKFRALATKAIDENKSVEDFNAELLGAIPGVKKANPITMRGLGMNAAEQDEYSIGRALRSMLVNKGRVEGLEGEVHEAMLQQHIGVDPEGVWVPPDAMMRVRARGFRHGRRDLNVTAFGQGGALVPTILQVPIIEILRNRMVCERLGVQPLSGLAGNVAIPRQTGAATAYAVPESGALTKSTQALDQIGLTPHRVGAWNDYTRQLLLQSSIDVENFIRDDIMKVLALKWDYLILQGAGANDEPLGIMNTPGIGSVNFAGTATWAKVIAFETALGLANADAGNMAYVTTPSVRGAWKAIPKIAASTFPIFLWDKGDQGDGSSDGEVNGYRAAATNQILNNAVAFGNWEDCIGPAMWGGYDFIVNPYTLDTQGEVRVTCNTYGDVATRHAQSFCWSADAGNQ
jgi:HK97 family phage major capsid protein